LISLGLLRVPPSSEIAYFDAMLLNREIPPFAIKFPLRLLFLICLIVGAGFPARAQGTDVDLQGTVVDADGAPVAGATIKLLESALATTSDADGKFALKGNVAIGILRRTRLPGNLGLSFRDGVVTLERPSAGGMRVEWFPPGAEVSGWILPGWERVRADPPG
jgi:hypothetical protein